VNVQKNKNIWFRGSKLEATVYFTNKLSILEYFFGPLRLNFPTIPLKSAGAI
jgi:hypothetical protein